MEGVCEFVYSVLVVSVSGAAVTMFAPDDNGVSKYIHFLVSIVVTVVLLSPMFSVAGKLPELISGDIVFDIKRDDATSYKETVVDQTCRNIGKELADRLYERFDVGVSEVEVYSNGEVEDLKIESVKIYYSVKNSLLYSDTVNFIKDIFGGECEVYVMYEDTKP